MKILVQNTKMKKTSAVNGARVFNYGLPADKTCLQKCAGCFALQGAYIWPVVKNAYQARLDHSKSENFISDMIKEIEKLKKRGPVIIRIHDSGDFYSLKYLKAWAMIMNYHSEVKFYAYTKYIARLKAVELPANFTVIFSEGGIQEHLINRDSDRHARVFESLDQLTAAGYVDATNDDLVAAFNPSNKIGLVYHGQKKFESSSWA